MPQYIYTGESGSLSIAGRSLDRGQPTMLEGRAAEAAEAHPDIEPYVDLAGGDAPTGLNRYAALKVRAKDLGIPATGKANDLAAAVDAEEARMAAEAAD